MAFGLGKKKEEAAQGTQMSPEAMAMLTQMAQQDGSQQSAPMAPSMPPADQPAQAASQIPGQIPGQIPAPASAPMFDQSSDLGGVGSANSNLTKKEQRVLARDQKKAAAQAAKEEKARQRRAKKGAKSRFRAPNIYARQRGSRRGSVLSACAADHVRSGPVERPLPVATDKREPRDRKPRPEL